MFSSERLSVDITMMMMSLLICIPLTFDIILIFFSFEVNHRFSSTCLQLSRNILLLECVNNTMLNLCRQNCKRDYNYVHTKYALKSTQINMFARSHYNATIHNFIYSLLLALSR